MLCILHDTTRYSIQRPYILQRNSSAVFWSDKLSIMASRHLELHIRLISWSDTLNMAKETRFLRTLNGVGYPQYMS